MIERVTTGLLESSLGNNMSRTAVLETVKQMFGANVVVCDEFETDLARHVCKSGNSSMKIYLLTRVTIPVVDYDGSRADVMCYRCPLCGKSYVLRESLEPIQQMGVGGMQGGSGSRGVSQP